METHLSGWKFSIQLQKDPTKPTSSFNCRWVPNIFPFFFFFCVRACLCVYLFVSREWFLWYSFWNAKANTEGVFWYLSFWTFNAYLFVPHYVSDFQCKDHFWFVFGNLMWIVFVHLVMAFWYLWSPRKPSWWTQPGQIVWLPLGPIEIGLYKSWLIHLVDAWPGLTCLGLVELAEHDNIVRKDAC